MSERTCNRCNRPLAGRQEKYCSHACANRDNMRRKSQRLAEQPWNICTVDGCEKNARSRSASLCPMHYHRQYRYGTLQRTTDLVQQGVLPRKGTDITGKRYGTLTALRYEGRAWLCRCDCGATRKASIGELNRAGEANTCGVKANHLSDAVDYAAAHGRVRRARGPASRYSCVDCGRNASHWSYDHADPDERHSTAPRTEGTAFSLKVDHYEPRCVSCHKLFDLGRADGTARVVEALA